MWKVISGDGAEVTSECLGSKETIECLVDTAISCSVWSQGPSVTVDRQIYRDPICDSPGLFYEHLYMGDSSSPKRLTRYLYFTDQWVLKAEDITDNILRFAGYSDRTLKEGDTVVDVFAIRCSESHTCSKGTGQPFDPEYGAGCPIISCGGFPHQSIEYNGEYYDIPRFSFIVRQTESGWKIVTPYAAMDAGSDWRGLWKPRHWKRK